MDETQKNGVDITDIAESLDSQNQQSLEASQKQADNSKILLSNVRLRQAVTDGLESLARVLTAHEPKVVVKNQPKVAVSVKVPEIADVVARLEDLIKLESADETYQPVVDALNGLKDFLSSQDKTEAADYTEQFANLETAIKSLDIQPQVNLKPNIKVQNDLTELNNVTDAVGKVEKAIGKIKIPAAPKVDTKSVKDAVDKVYEAISNLSFPVPNYVLPYATTSGKATQITLTADGKLPVDAALNITSADGAINDGVDSTKKASVVQSATDGTKYGVVALNPDGTAISGGGGGGGGTDVQYTDGGTPPVHPVGTVPVYDAAGTWKSVSTSNKLPVATGLTQPTTPSDTQPVSVASLPLPSGAATGAKQDTGNTSIASIDTKTPALGQALSAASVPVVLPAAQITTLTPPAAITGFATSAKQDTGNTSLSSIDTSNTAINTVLGAKTDAKSTATDTTSVSAMQVLKQISASVQAPPTQAVTGTFWQTTQPVSLATNTPTIAAGSAIIGKVGIDQTTDGTTNKVYVGNIPHVVVDSAPSTVVSGSVTANAGTNLNTSALALDATLTGGSAKSVVRGGAKGTTTAADVTSTASGANHNVLDVAIYDGSGNLKDPTAIRALTSSDQVTVANATLAVTKSGTWDVTNAGTFAVQATLSAETTKVLGVVRTADGSGNLLTSTSNALDVNLKTSAASNLSTNLAQVNGATTLAGNGASGTGAQRVTIASDSTGQVTLAANATATGTSIYKNTALNSTKAAANASAGNLYGYHIYNPNSAVAYVQFWNAASASVTVGTTAADMILAIPAGGWADAPATGPPIAFGTALTVAATTTATGSSALTTGLLVNLWYK